jgi:hypothetical protein
MRTVLRSTLRTGHQVPLAVMSIVLLSPGIGYAAAGRPACAPLLLDETELQAVCTEIFYVSNSGDGPEWSPAEFNDSDNWAVSDSPAVDGLIGPRDCVVLEDDEPIASALTIQRGGTDTDPIRITGLGTATVLGSRAVPSNEWFETSTEGVYYYEPPNDPELGQWKGITLYEDGELLYEAKDGTPFCQHA